MLPSLPRIVSPLVFVAVCLLVSAEFLHQPWIMFVTKPLAIALILSISLANWKKQPTPFAFWISIGLLLSLIGDVVLMFSERLFVYGLISFLFAEVSYLIAFTRDVRFPAHFSVWFLYLAVVAFFYGFLFPTLPPTLRLPVAIYTFFALSMAAQAAGRFLILSNPPAASAALGTLLFMLSDALLSFDRFHTPIPHASLFVLTPYFIAQWLIALSTHPLPAPSQTFA